MNRDNRKSTEYLGALGAFLGLGLMAGAASADVLGVTTVPNLQVDGVPPFPPTTVATVFFTTTVPNQRVVITFNAECSVAGGPTSRLLNDILVNPAGPQGDIIDTNSDKALCTGNHTSTQGDGKVSAVSTRTLVVPTAGVHFASVRVLFNPNFPSFAWEVDNITVVVEN